MYVSIRAFKYDTKKLFEPILKTVNKAGQKLLDDSKVQATATGNINNSFPPTSNALALTQIFCSQDDDDEDKNGDSESHVGKANDFDCFCNFQTVSALYLDKFFSKNPDDFCDRLHLLIQQKLSEIGCHRLGI